MVTSGIWKGPWKSSGSPGTALISAIGAKQDVKVQAASDGTKKTGVPQAIMFDWPGLVS